MSESSSKTTLEAGEIARFLSYLAILAASVVLFVSAGTIPSSRFETLGAGAFPRFVYGAICLVAVIAIADGLRKISRNSWAHFGAETFAWAKRSRLVFVCLAAFAIYIVALPILGFSIASFIFVLSLQIILMPRRPVSILVAIVVALTFSFGLNWLFAEVFTVFLPRGVM
ncbi:tripartite tricarboxylate transporter TctB family protein [Roseibium sp.]|uniref:tripartite tricarboxylate transporter TctB family protein n=1 Tax=Roseibium sp. TaxID=1936156 RepID=UPI003A97C436